MPWDRTLGGRRRPRWRVFYTKRPWRAMSRDRDKQSQLDRDAVALMTFMPPRIGVYRSLYGRHGRRAAAASPLGIRRRGAALDEERRLCYVGVTRAKRRLTLTMALARNKWANPGRPCPAGSYTKSPAGPIIRITGRSNIKNIRRIPRCLRKPPASHQKSRQFRQNPLPIAGQRHCLKSSVVGGIRIKDHSFGVLFIPQNIF